MNNFTTSQVNIKLLQEPLTAIILIPLALSESICLKNTSAVPLTGGRHTRGTFTLLGPESYTFQT
jgi:hypothetical protein